MRHDPDIIMIGEIRDDKAAKMSVRAANTGHLVLSTIHASSASAIISRMIDLGVNENHLYEMLLALIYQRLFFCVFFNFFVIRCFFKIINFFQTHYHMW